MLDVAAGEKVDARPEEHVITALQHGHVIAGLLFRIMVRTELVEKKK